jgi:serine/threonine-protein kinase
LGITLYQAAVGEPPFTGPPIVIASQHVNLMPTMPSVLGARLSREVESLIFDCVQKDPNLRPTAKEIHERLSEAAGAAHPTHAQAPPPISIETEERTHALSPEVPPTRSSPGEIQREGDRNRRRRGPVLLAAVALLLIALGVASAFAMLGDVNINLAQNFPEENQQASPSGDGGQDALSTGSEESVSSQEQAAKGNSGGGRRSSDAEAAAAQAVKDFYASAAARDYEGSSALLTADWRQRYFPSPGAFEGTFSTLKRVRFVEEPEVQISDGTATVTGETIAEHTDRTERNRGTWTLVNVNGKWIISGWNVNNISTQPA